MKNLIIIGVIVGLIYYFKGTLLGMLGVGSGAYGITDVDPLGNPEKLMIKFAGHLGEEGEAGSPRTITLESDFDKKEYPDFTPGTINIQVGDEEYVQRVSFVFFSTQRGYSPQRKNTYRGLRSGFLEFNCR